jgi:uncharacterized membrane protein
MPDVLNVIMRWLHISSVVTLIGGVLYGRLVATPAIAALTSEGKSMLDDSMAAHYKPLVYGAIMALVVSGLYNIFVTPGHSLRYHVLLGVKLLLVLHVFATALLMVQKGAERRARRMTGILISGLIIIAISAYLRRIF